MISNCTELMRVLPQDPDGPLRESLASLFIRTAQENDVSPAQMLERRYSYAAGIPRPCYSARAMGQSIAQSISGSGDPARAFVARTEELTRIRGLSASTTIAFAPFTTINGLMRQKLAWSAEFLGEQETQYYPLLWALDPVRVCPRMKKPLVSLCPQCREPLPVLRGTSLIGRCYCCGASLAEGKITAGAADSVASSIRCMDYEIWVAEQLGEYIRFQVSSALPENFRYTEMLRFWMDAFKLRADTDSARLVGASQNALINWLHGGAIPRLRMTLNLCWVFGVSLQQFLSCKIPGNHPGSLRKSIDAGMRHASVSRRRRVDRADLEHQLKTILRENKYAMMSFSEICSRKLKRGDLVVRQIFPELGRAIAKRYLENRRLTAQVRQEQFCAEIKALSRCLHARGMVPNHKTLAPFIDRPTRLRCAWAIEAIREVRLELGYEDASEQLLLKI